MVRAAAALLAALFLCASVSPAFAGGSSSVILVSDRPAEPVSEKEEEPHAETGSGSGTGESASVVSVSEKTDDPVTGKEVQSAENPADGKENASASKETAEEPEEGKQTDAESDAGADADQAPAEEAEDPSAVFLELIPRSETVFTNVLFHYVYFDASVRNAERLTVRVLNPNGKQVGFRTRRHVDNNLPARNTAGYALKKGQELQEGMNVLFQSGRSAGTWTIEVTASAAKKKSATQTLQVFISEARPLHMNRLPEVHAMMLGLDGTEPQPVERGKIRYVSQDPEENLFVREYWFSGAFDLRPTAKQKCTRACLSMALSWFGIDCTPIRMSEMLKSREIFYTYDQVCEKLGNVIRVQGDLETLWADYQAGEGSPVLIHFDYDEGMHAVLLVARDEEDPELFYGINAGQRANTTAHPDGMRRDPVLPILIEKGETGQRIQSPLLKRYHKAVIDEIWQWKLTSEP
ncbi:MAG: hypothetical protein K5922_08360 [Clostridiales bacterium]|nr:hypothetical protein [Clostridiales bacterium]